MYVHRHPRTKIYIHTYINIYVYILYVHTYVHAHIGSIYLHNYTHIHVSIRKYILLLYIGTPTYIQK